MLPGCGLNLECVCVGGVGRTLDHVSSVADTVSDTVYKMKYLAVYEVENLSYSDTGVPLH